MVSSRTVTSSLKTDFYKEDQRIHDLLKVLITAQEGITLEEAKKILAKARKEKLPIVDKDFNLKGLITIKDIEKQIKYPLSAKDAQGRLLCGAASRYYSELSWNV